MAPKTVENYEWHVRDSYSLFNGRYLAYLSEDDILTWWRHRLDTGKLTTASQAYVLLGGIFEKAVKERIVGASPVDIPGAASLRTGKEVTIPTDAEVADVLDALEEGFWGSLFLTEAWSQARFGELIGLRRQAVLIDYRDVSGELVPELTISIRVGVTRTKRDGIVIGTPKSSAGLREVMLPELASRELLAYMQKTETPETQPTDFIWPSRTDAERPLAYSMYGDEWAATIKRANVPYFNAHGPRHYGLTAYAQSGATLKEIQERGGHSSAGVSMRYQHAATSRRSELVNRAAAGAASAAEHQREVRRKKAMLAAQLAALDAEERELEGG